MRCAGASKPESSNGGGISTKCVSRLASFRGGARNVDFQVGKLVLGDGPDKEQSS